MGPWEWAAVILLVAAVIFVFFVERRQKKEDKRFDARMEMYRAAALDRISRQQERDRSRRDNG